MTRRVAHPELVTQCKGDKGWRRDAFGDWWPCQGVLREQDERTEQAQDRAAD